VSLTSYVARHSWATIAQNSNVPISVISAALGHTTEQTTRIYLSAIDNSKIDEANSRIISLVDA
jgi:integrase